MSRARAGSFDRLIRVRQVRARLALAALGRAQARVASEGALLARVDALLAAGGSAPGEIAANAATARGSADAMLGRLSDDVAARLATTRAEQAARAQALARARAAVDAAVARAQARKDEA